MIKVHIDYSWDSEEYSLEHALADDTQPDVSLRVVVAGDGPGGNWPVVEVTGPETSVMNWLAHRGYGFDEYEVVA